MARVDCEVSESNENMFGTFGVVDRKPKKLTHQGFGKISIIFPSTWKSVFEAVRQTLHIAM